LEPLLCWTAATQISRTDHTRIGVITTMARMTTGVLIKKAQAFSQKSMSSITAPTTVFGEKGHDTNH